MNTAALSLNEQINERRWQIVQAKNADLDGAFFFGVSSTGIYCKPSCAARLPKRENTFFFATQAEAEQAGFRACLRCRPTEQLRSKKAELTIKACQLIERGETSLSSLADELNVSASHLQRIFKELIGVSPKEFAEAQRFSNFKKQVKQMDVTTALYESGFGSNRALYEKANENLGMTPATYRRGGKNARINYAIVDTSLGKLMVAATEKGICSVTFGATEEDLTKNLIKEFPAAEIQSDNNNLQDYVGKIVAHLDGACQALELPIDLQATAFQRKVWAELRRIPYGETRSYGQLAESLGNKQAVRAVARACATNPVALIHPCHRVIGADGKLSGYAWGVERKKMLLDREQLFSTKRREENTKKK